MNSNSVFRELGQKYYEGLLDFEDYRSKRRQLINQLTDATTSLVEANKPAQEREAAAGTKPYSFTQKQGKSMRRSTLLLITLLLIALAGGFYWYSLSGGSLTFDSLLQSIEYFNGVPDNGENK